MINRERLKTEIDGLPEDVVEQVQAFVLFQKFKKGLWPSDTEYLSSIPGMVDSIVEGLNTPLSECFDTLE